MTLGKKAEFIAVALVFSVAILLVILFSPKQREVVYNCSIAEISPDFPVEAREACRKLRMEQK